MKAPFGAQDDWNTDLDWAIYMACGNEGNEGESGATANTYMIDSMVTGWSAAKVSPSSTTDKTVINDMTVDLTFPTKHGADTSCTLWLTFMNDFVPSVIYLGGTECADQSSTYAKCKFDKEYAATSTVKIHFYYTWVNDKTIPTTGLSLYLIKQAHVYSGWNN